jgi:FKBP-type peptidyl-prolyl cis-trans isomerase 2
MKQMSVFASLAMSVIVLAAGGPVGAAQDETIADGKKVVIEFTITVPEEHAVIPKNVAQFVQGKHDLLPALESALNGLKAGETKRVDLKPDQAFGPYDESKKMKVAREELPSDLRPGAIMQNRDGRPFTVVEVSDKNALIDYNHPLAGKHLVFEVKVLQVGAS